MEAELSRNLLMGAVQTRNGKKLKSFLDDTLKENGITTIYVVGIATDYCVYYSTIDALALGYEVFLVLDATRRAGRRHGADHGEHGDDDENREAGDQ